MKKQAGLSLLEMLLATSIIVIIILIGYRAILQFRQQNQTRNLQTKVDMLFLAMSKYYFVNCRDRYMLSNGEMIAQPKSGKLSPASNPPVNSVITIQDLIDAGYLTNWQPLNLLIYPEKNLNDSYILQYNRQTATRYTSVQLRALGTVDKSAPLPPLNSEPEEIFKKNSVILWRLQVAIHMRSTKDIEMYKTLMGASCISELNNKMVTPCNQPHAEKDYLVWDRLPSAAVPSVSSLWPSMIRAKQFNQDYTNDDFYAFSAPENSDWNYTSNYENYLCGG